MAKGKFLSLSKVNCKTSLADFYVTIRGWKKKSEEVYGEDGDRQTGVPLQGGA